MGSRPINEHIRKSKLAESDGFGFADPVMLRYLQDIRSGWLPFPSFGAGVPRERTGNNPKEPAGFVSEWERVQAVLWSRYLADRNPIAIAFLEHITNFVLGSGLTWSATYQGAKASSVAGTDPVLAGVEKFWDSFRRDQEWGEGVDDREFETHIRLMRDGEVFIRLGKSGSRVWMRFIEPEHIKLPINSKADPTWACGVKVDDDDNEHVIAYYYQPDPLSDGEVIPAEEIIHLKANVDRSIKRGIPDLFPVRDMLDAVYGLLFNLGDSARSLSSIHYITEHAPTTTIDQVQSMISLGQSYEAPNYKVPGGYDLESVQVSKPGVRHISSGQKLSAVPASNAEAFIRAEQAILRAVGVRWGCPEYFSGDASNANFASTAVAGGPFEKAVTRRQRKFASFEAELARRSLDLVNSTLASRIVCDVTLPPVAIANKNEDESIRSMQFQNRIISRRTWQQQAGVDPEVEDEAIKADQLSDQNQQQQQQDPYAMAESSNTPPGPPPRPGLTWNPQSHRWIHRDSGEEFEHHIAAFHDNPKLISVIKKAATAIAYHAFNLNAQLLSAGVTPQDIIDTAEEWGSPIRSLGSKGDDTLSQSTGIPGASWLAVSVAPKAIAAIYTEARKHLSKKKESVNVSAMDSDTFAEFAKSVHGVLDAVADHLGASEEDRYSVNEVSQRLRKTSESVKEESATGKKEWPKDKFGKPVMPSKISMEYHKKGIESPPPPGGPPRPGLVWRPTTHRWVLKEFEHDLEHHGYTHEKVMRMTGAYDVKRKKKKAIKVKYKDSLTPIEVQRHCEEHNEGHLMKEIDGVPFPNSEPMDGGTLSRDMTEGMRLKLDRDKKEYEYEMQAWIDRGKRGEKPKHPGLPEGIKFRHLYELKSSVGMGKEKAVRINNYAAIRKLIKEHESGAPFHTIAIDDSEVVKQLGADYGIILTGGEDAATRRRMIRQILGRFQSEGSPTSKLDLSKRKMYYRRGVAGGVVKYSDMHEIEGDNWEDKVRELTKLRNAEESKLPDKAKRNTEFTSKFGNIADWKEKRHASTGKKYYVNRKLRHPKTKRRPFVIRPAKS